METSFDILYLVTVVVLGLIMVVKRKNDRQYKLFGIMALVLGFGDAFHLLPRIYALFTTGLEANAVLLGFGKFITSITMTIFYVVLFHVWQLRYNQKDDGLKIFVYLLAGFRVLLCLFPQNEWLSYNPPVDFGIYRNIPFVVLGIVIVVLFYKTTSKGKDKDFRFIPLFVALSFAFYIPVVLFVNVYKSIGVLMIPKTLSYVAIILTGYISMKNTNKVKSKYRNQQ